MTMRTYRYFVCANGHQGEEKISENDQPYSMNWESVAIKDMKELGTGSRGDTTYICSQCNKPMQQTAKPDPTRAN